MSLSLVVLEEKLFTRTCTQTTTLQSDDIKIKTDQGLILTQGNLLVAWYIYAKDMREIPVIVNEKIVIKC